MSGRQPPPPRPVEEWAHEHAGVGLAARGEALVDGAVRAIEAALARPGRDRDGAFALLAADALLTYACEDAAADPDPEASLMEILSRVQRVRLP